MKHLIYIAELIERAGFATLGKDIFIGTMPGSVTNGVMLRSPLSGDKIDEGQGGFFDTTFTMIVRSESVPDGYQKCLAISQMLTRGHANASDFHIIRLRPDTLPVTYPRGDADTLETAVTMSYAFGDNALA